MSSVNAEIQRLLERKLINIEQAECVDPQMIVNLFTSRIGCQIRQSSQVLREFKFSILDDSGKYTIGTDGEEVLLQGVVDCALIDEDGITIIDFKTDRVSAENLMDSVAQYTPQVSSYAVAMERIYQLPVKAAFLYYFNLNRAVAVSL